MKSLNRQQKSGNMRFAIIVIFLFLSAIFLPFRQIVMSRSQTPGSFKRLDFLPGRKDESSLGSYYFDFNGKVTGRIVKKSEIPVFYVDFLGASIDKSPFVMNFSNGPAKMVRLTQISEQPRVIRSTFFLRKAFSPILTDSNRGPVVSFKLADKDENKNKTIYSLIPPDALQAENKPAKNARTDEEIRLKFSNADINKVYRELSRKLGKIVYVRDRILESDSIDLTAKNPMEAIEKLAEKFGQVVTFEDNEIWISDPHNPILMIPGKFMIKGADLTGLSLGDVLRAMGQVAELNIVLDPSMKEIKERPVSMYLKKQSVRRGVENLLKLNGLRLEKIDKNTLLVLTQERARQLEGKVVRVYSPKIPIETLISLLENTIDDEIKKRVKINQDIGNIVVIGDKAGVEKVLEIITNIEGKLTRAGEGYVRNIFQAINTEVEELIKLTLETLDEKEKLSIVHDNRTDRIIIAGAPKTVEKAMSIMKRLDQPETRQALINIKLLEVSRSALEDIGIDLPQTLVNTQNIGHIKSTDYIIPAQLVAFIENTDAKTLANPTIRCMDKEESTIDISEQIPVKNTVTEYLPVASASLAARTTDNWTTSEVGIKMSIKPIIHENNEISMDVDIDQTELLSLVEGHPWTAKRQIKTRVRVADKETVIIGGLIRKKKTDRRKPVPLLRRIPLLKRLFKKVERRNQNEERVEMVVLITPSVVGSGSKKKQVSDNKERTKRLTASKIEN